MEIVKAEILWTRKCTLNCKYCGMATGEVNTVPKNHWKKGINQLKKLGCKFIAFYGAEPLQDNPWLLADVMGYAERKNIPTTVITNGVVAGTMDILKNLLGYGVKSLTMSYDIVYPDEATKRKAKSALIYLDYFEREARNFREELRDRAVVTTLTAKNCLKYPSSVRDFSKRGIWSLFDLIHPDRGQPRSKCKNYPGMEHELFMDTRNIVRLYDTVQELKIMKKQKYLLHTSTKFLDHISGKIEANGFTDPYTWNCADGDCFPSWVTVDCDGTVYPCDDFQPKPNSGDRLEIKVWEIADKWDDFKLWRDIVKFQCPGCLWNTHMDAHWIKKGAIPVSDYVHKE